MDWWAEVRLALPGLLGQHAVLARRGLHLRAANDASVVDHRHRLRDGAVAGAPATVVSSLLMNVLVHVVAEAAVLAPGELVEHTQARLAAFSLARVVAPVSCSRPHQPSQWWAWCGAPCTGPGGRLDWR